MRNETRWWSEASNLTSSIRNWPVLLEIEKRQGFPTRLKQEHFEMWQEALACMEPTMQIA